MAERVYPDPSHRSSRGGFGPMKRELPYHNYASQDLKQARRPAPPVYDGRPRRRNRCCLCMSVFCGILLLLIVLLGIAVLVFFLVVRPKAPKYDVQDVRLSKFAVSPSTSSGFSLDAVTTYTVQARNPNKKIGIYYDDIKVAVFSEGTSIGSGEVPAFYQGHRNTTVISGDLTSTDLPLDSAVGTALQSALVSNSVPLFVTVDVRARVKIGAWKSPHFWVHVRCNVNVNPRITSGSQVLSKKCSVKR